MTIFSQLLATHERNRARRSAIRALHNLSQQQLADIGVLPGQIEDAVDGLLDASDERGATRGYAPAATPRPLAHAYPHAL